MNWNLGLGGLGVNAPEGSRGLLDYITPLDRQAKPRYRWLTLAEAAKRLGVSWPRAVNLARESKVIVRLAGGSYWLFRSDSVARYARHHRGRQ